MRLPRDILTEQFYRWEARGRGWQLFDEPVEIEPPFRPFRGHFLPPPQGLDDGRRHGLLSGLLDRIGKGLRAAGGGDDELPVDVEEDEPLPRQRERAGTAESRIILPRDRKFSKALFESFVLSLGTACEPVAFEIVGTGEATTLQFAGHPGDLQLVRRQLQGRFPSISFQEADGALADAWNCSGPAFEVAEFGLRREFMLTLAASGEWHATLFSALSELEEGELGVFQVIFEPARHRWGESALIAVTDGTGGPFFINRPELPRETAQKFGSPLFAAVMRFASCADDPERAWRIIAEMASGLSALARPGGNSLVPLGNGGYDAEDHQNDLILRQSRRAGMLLNLGELASLIQFPDAGLHVPRLQDDPGLTRAAPPPRGGSSIYLGSNLHAGREEVVSLSLEQRVRHLHVIGASGTGKSTLLFNLIRQDIETGQGVGLLDPHGDLVDRVLGIIPEERIEDVILVDPADADHSVGFNILSAHSDFEKTLLASDLVSIFQRLSTSWGDQMGSVLNNAILAFLESSEGGTLSDLRKFLLDATWRKSFLRTVTDPDIAYYWEKGFPQLGGNRSIGPVLTRLEGFLAPKPIRYMVSQRRNRIDLGDITDSGKIFLARLSQGQMGRENAYLLGSLLVSKFQQAAMARQRLKAEERRPFWLYVDEFQNFITPSMAEILSGARKYQLGLTLAHQDLNQLRKEPDVASAVLSNACTRIVFRVSEGDAKALEGGFSHFGARELQNLDVGEAICRIERSDHDFNLSVPFQDYPDDEEASRTCDRVTRQSRERYATARSEIEAEIRRQAASSPDADTGKPTEDRETQERSPRQSKASSEGEKPREQSPTGSQPPEEKAPGPTVSDSTSTLPHAPSSDGADALAAADAARAETPISTTPSLEKKTSSKSPENGKTANKEFEPTGIREDIQNLGRGGELHKATQLELKQISESLGFRAVIERQLPPSMDSVDLFLQRGEAVIGCEISVTNTLEYELRNVTKILRAGIPVVALVALYPEKLQKLSATIKNSLPQEQAAKVRCFLKAEFISFLQILVTETPIPEALGGTVQSDGSKRIKGWKVKRTTVDLSTEELRKRESDLAAALADSARRKPRRKKPE